MSKALELTLVPCNKMLRFAYTFQGLVEVTLETKARCPRRVNGLFLVERFVNRDGATFAYLECPLCRLKSIEPQRYRVDPGRNLHASRCELSCGGSVHDDFRALWNGVHLRPGDAACRFLVERYVELRLDIVLDLDATGISLITRQPQDQVVLPGRERQRYRRLTRLFRSVDEDIGTRGLTADENTFGQRFKLDPLVMGVATLYLQRGLHGLIAVLLHLKAVPRGIQIVKAAGRFALVQDVTRGTAQHRGSADHVGHDMNRSVPRRRNRVRALVRAAGGCHRCVVVLEMIDHADVRRGVPQ